jgi:hypothetical protein
MKVYWVLYSLFKHSKDKYARSVQSILLRPLIDLRMVLGRSFFFFFFIYLFLSQYGKGYKGGISHS